MEAVTGKLAIQIPSGNIAIVRLTIVGGNVAAQFSWVHEPTEADAREGGVMLRAMLQDVLGPGSVSDGEVSFAGSNEEAARQVREWLGGGMG